MLTCLSLVVCTYVISHTCGLVWPFRSARAPWTLHTLAVKLLMMAFACKVQHKLLYESCICHSVGNFMLELTGQRKYTCINWKGQTEKKNCITECQLHIWDFSNKMMHISEMNSYELQEKEWKRKRLPFCSNWNTEWAYKRDPSSILLV